MKDPTYELIHAIVTALDGHTLYGTYAFDVYEDLPERTSNNYVWFPGAILTDESDQDHYRTAMSLTIQVVSKNQQGVATRQSIVDIGTDILTLVIKQTFSMTNHNISVKPFLESITHGTAFPESGGLMLTADYVVRMQTQEK